MKNIIYETKRLLIVCLSLWFTNTYAQTYYVDALNGSNSNTGTSPSKPWATIQKAADAAVGSSTIIIAGGTYYEKVTITNRINGVVGAPTIFKNKDGETVIIEGQVFNPDATIARWVSQISIKGAQYITLKGITLICSFYSKVLIFYSKNSILSF